MYDFEFFASKPSQKSHSASYQQDFSVKSVHDSSKVARSEVISEELEQAQANKKEEVIEAIKYDDELEATQSPQKKPITEISVKQNSKGSQTFDVKAKPSNIETSLLVQKRSQTLDKETESDITRKKKIFLKKQGIPEMTISQIMNTREVNLSKEAINDCLLCYAAEKPKKSLSIKPPFNPTFYKGKSAKSHVLFARKISGFENCYLQGGKSHKIYFRDGKDSIQEIDVSRIYGYSQGSLNTDEFYEINEGKDSKITS